MRCKSNKKGNIKPMIRKDIAFSLGCQISHLIEHILNKYPVPFGRDCHENVSNCSDELAVLDDRAARHECVQVGTTFLFNFAFCIFRPRTNDSVARLEDSIPYILVRHNDLYPLSYGDADFKKR